MISHVAVKSVVREMTRTGFRQHHASAVLARLFLFSALVYCTNSHAQSDEYDRLIFDPVPLSSLVREDESANVSAEIPASGNNESTAPGSEATADLRTLNQLQAALEESLAAGGLYSTLLRERYLDLARLQQRIGQHEAAVRTLDSAMHIARVNEGLFTPSQIVDLELMIENTQALGDINREAELRGYLYYVQRKAYAPDDPRLLAAMEAWADWNLLAFQQSVSANPSEVILPGYTRPEELVVIRNARTGDARFIPRRHMLNMSTAQLASSSSLDSSPYALMPEMVVDDRLTTATDIFEELLDVSREEDSPENIGLATRKLAATEYALKWQMDHMLGNNDQSFLASTRRADARRDLPMINRGYNKSRDAFFDYIELLRTYPGTTPDILARAWIDLGDFHLAYGEEIDARDAWRNAVTHLREAGHDDMTIDAILNPPPPFQTPGFVVHPFQRALFSIAPDDTLNHQGYIDVSMDISRDGSTRSVTIIRASEETPQRIRTLLLDHLRTQKFRPLFNSDELSGMDDLQTRYYYSY